METFKCVDCKQEKPVERDGGTGYARIGKSKRKVCYACCATRDASDMRKTGRATLYLTKLGNGYEVSNWPGTLKLPVVCAKEGRHNIAGKRVDVWFRFEGREWHGVQVGEWTQICRAKALKGDR